MSEWKEIAEQGQVSTWTPEEGEELEGQLTRIDKGVGANQSTVYEITMTSGEKVILWDSAVLNSKLGTVAVGSDVKIIYLGKRKSKKGPGTYKDYKVFSKANTTTDVKDVFDKDVPF